MLLLLLLLPFTALGQAPGYMGKRLSVMAEGSFFNALFHPNHNMNSGWSNFSFNVRGTVSIDYAVARNASVGADLDLLVTGMEYDWQPGHAPHLPEGYGHALLRGRGYGLHWSVFRNPSRGGIAPIGSYTRFGIMLLDVRVNPRNRDTGQDYAFYEQVLTPMVSIAVGKQRVLFDHLLLMSSIRLGIVPLGIAPYFQISDNKLERDSPRALLAAHAESRLFTYSLLNVSVGIGLLAPLRQRPR